MFTHTQTLHWSLRQDHDRCSAECSKVNTESTFAHAFSRTHHFTSTHQKHSFSAATSTDAQQGASSDTATSWDICMWPPSSQPATRTAHTAHLTPAHCSAAAVVAAATVPITQRRGGRLPRSKRRAAPPSYAGSSADFPSLLPSSPCRKESSSKISDFVGPIGPMAHGDQRDNPIINGRPVVRIISPSWAAAHLRSKL